MQVRGRGDAYYTSDLEPRAADLARQPATFDPLATVLVDAHQARHARARVDQPESRVERRGAAGVAAIISSTGTPSG